jgi:hypothetical protein
VGTDGIESSSALCVAGRRRGADSNERRLPFIFTSGYGKAALPEKFRDRPVLQKPFLITNLEDTIKATLGPGRNGRPANAK